MCESAALSLLCVCLSEHEQNLFLFLGVSVYPSTGSVCIRRKTCKNAMYRQNVFGKRSNIHETSKSGSDSVCKYAFSLTIRFSMIVSIEIRKEQHPFLKFYNSNNVYAIASQSKRWKHNIVS